MTDDPCDAWPVIVFNGRLTLVERVYRTWLLGGDGYCVSWSRIGEDDHGDTVYECVMLHDIDPAPKPDVFGDANALFARVGEGLSAFGERLRACVIQSERMMAPPLMDVANFDDLGYRKHEYGGRRWRKPR